MKDIPMKGLPKININDENAPLIVVFPDTMVNEKFKDKIIKRIKANDGYCPCVKERYESTFCPCEDYLNTHDCHCNLYVKIARNENIG